MVHVRSTHAADRRRALRYKYVVVTVQPPNDEHDTSNVATNNCRQPLRISIAVQTDDVVTEPMVQMSVPSFSHGTTAQQNLVSGDKGVNKEAVAICLESLIPGETTVIHNTPRTLNSHVFAPGIWFGECESEIPTFKRDEEEDEDCDDAHEVWDDHVECRDNLPSESDDPQDAGDGEYYGKSHGSLDDNESEECYDDLAITGLSEKERIGMLEKSKEGMKEMLEDLLAGPLRNIGVMVQTIKEVADKAEERNNEMMERFGRVETKFTTLDHRLEEQDGLIKKLSDRMASFEAPRPAAAAPVPARAPLPAYTMVEVGMHNRKDDCWIVVNGQVLNVTSFLSEDPVADSLFLAYAGEDATEEFKWLPPDVISKYVPNAIIGVVADLPSGTLPSDTYRDCEICVNSDQLRCENPAWEKSDSENGSECSDDDEENTSELEKRCSEYSSDEEEYDSELEREAYDAY